MKKKRYTCFVCKAKRYEEHLTLIFKSDILPVRYSIHACSDSCTEIACTLIANDTHLHPLLLSKLCNR